MGKVSKEEREQILLNCSTKLKTYINKLHDISEDSLFILIILLGQYLFARYSIFGKFDGVNYTVYTKHITDNLCIDEYRNLTTIIIRLRNLIAHNYGSNSMALDMNSIRGNLDTLNDFLEFLLCSEQDVTSKFMEVCNMA